MDAAIDEGEIMRVAGQLYGDEIAPMLKFWNVSDVPASPVCVALVTGLQMSVLDHGDPGFLVDLLRATADSIEKGELAKRMTEGADHD